MRNLTAAIFAAIIAASVCAATNFAASADEKPKLPFSLPATFQGITPCADCSGIHTTIRLEADGTYSLQRHYVERQAILGESGTWTYDANTARLSLRPTGGKSVELFAINVQPTLRMLDTQGDEIVSGMNFTLVEASSTANGLGSATWRLVELEGGAVSTAQGQPAATLEFDEATKHVSGSGGCNRISGSFTASGDKLTLPPLAMTMMMCADNAMKLETSFTRALGKVAFYKIDGQTLTLFSADRTPLAKFQAEK